MPHCCICDRPLSTSAWVCLRCEREHGLGLPLTKWPEWAAYLRTEEQRRRERLPLSQEKRALGARRKARAIAPTGPEQRAAFLAEEREREQIRRCDVVDIVPLADLPVDLSRAIERAWYGDGDD